MAGEVRKRRGTSLRARLRRARRAGLLRGGILPEIDVDLHADDQRAWFTQLDQRLHDVNVRHVTLAKGSIASGLYQRGNEGNRAGNIAPAKRGGTHQHGLPGLDLLNVALVRFGTDTQRRDVAEQD